MRDVRDVEEGSPQAEGGGVTYDQIVTRLEEIEEALAGLDQERDHPAAEFFRAKRDFEFAWAQVYLRQEGTVEERKQRTVLALYRSEDYKRYVSAEALYEAHKARARTLETRASIGQSLLRAATREAPQHGPQPAWSGVGS